ncbi:MAG: phosphonopyruvate decarboxylase [Kiritimatiellae bacterium]|nr:phosphonopyruvate decarboxylase [Kiritimatiellia bacterium]MDD4342406.1 phosphonopyruvate decarboxylase [Kiritimatiellia bacterium]
MIDPLEFLAALEKLDIRFVTGVPDSLLKNVCACLTTHFPPERHIIATNEGSAVGLAIGHYLATGRPALVYMQNAGLGNVVNPIASLADPQVYGIPMVLMIGWRGELLPDGEQRHDEPQHVKQGQITLAQLEILGIPYRIIDGQCGGSEPLLKELVESALSQSRPVALVVRKQTFAPFELPMAVETSSLTREAAIRAVVEALPGTVPIVSTTGMASRELFELRKAAGAGQDRDFLTVGGMGHASQIAAGIALAQPKRKTVCLDGDGALLMHMGGLAISADCPNLLHVVINNGAHDSVGGQPTKGAVLNFAEIARACGYASVFRTDNPDEIADRIRSMLEGTGSSFLEIKCKRGHRADLGRPTRTPAQSKTDFAGFLQKGIP